MSIQLAVAFGILFVLVTGCVAVIAAWVIDAIRISRTSGPLHYDRQDRDDPPQQHP